MKNPALSGLLALLLCPTAMSAEYNPTAITEGEAAARQQVYLGAHDFKQAKVLAEKYPAGGLEYVPGTIIESRAILENSGKYYEASMDGEMASLKSLDVSSGSFILVYADPGSPVTAMALNQAVADAALAPVLAAWGSLLTDKYDFRRTSEWNRVHIVKFRIMYSHSDWPGLNQSSAPVVNFLKNGRLICRVSGWEDGGFMPEFRKCAEAAGLLTLPARMAAALRIVESRVADKGSYSERVALFKKEFTRLADEGAFEKKALAAYPPLTLEDAYALAGYFVAYSPVKEKLELMEDVFTELENRKMANAGKARTLYNLLLDARAFGKAVLLRARYGGLEAFPSPVGKKPAAGGKFIYKIKPDGKALEVEKVAFKGKLWVIVGQPACHPTQKALKEIESNTALPGIFKKNGLLLASGSDFTGAKEWNGAHAIKFHLINSPQDWPGLDFGTYPSFYFLEDGKIVYSFTGWPQGGNMFELTKGLKLLGIK